MSPSQQRRRWFWFTGLAMAGVGFLIFSSWQAEKQTREAWSRAVAVADAIAAQFAPMEKAHAPLLGDARPGDAAEHYRRATKLAWEVPSPAVDEPQWEDLLTSAERPPHLAARLADVRLAAEALAAGAASDRLDARTFLTALQSAGPDDVPGALGLPWPVGSAPVYRFGMVTALFDLDAGRVGEAIQRTADALTLARDHLTVGMGIYDLLGATGVNVVNDAWTSDRLRALAPPAQRTLAEVLRRFDEHVRPATDCGRAECATQVRHARSDRVARRASTAEAAAYVDAIAALPPASASWAVRKPALAKAVACLPQGATSQLVAIEEQRRGAVAQVRLLRMALDHHLRGAITPLADPLGDGPLLVTERGDELVLASRCMPIPCAVGIERIVRLR